MVVVGKGRGAGGAYLRFTIYDLRFTIYDLDVSALRAGSAAEFLEQGEKPIRKVPEEPSGGGVYLRFTKPTRARSGIGQNA